MQYILCCSAAPAACHRADSGRCTSRRRRGCRRQCCSNLCCCRCRRSWCRRCRAAAACHWSVIESHYSQHHVELATGALRHCVAQSRQPRRMNTAPHRMPYHMYMGSDAQIVSGSCSALVTGSLHAKLQVSTHDTMVYIYVYAIQVLCFRSCTMSVHDSVSRLVSAF